MNSALDPDGCAVDHALWTKRTRGRRGWNSTGFILPRDDTQSPDRIPEWICDSICGDEFKSNRSQILRENRGSRHVKGFGPIRTCVEVPCGRAYASVVFSTIQWIGTERADAAHQTWR